MLSPSNGEPFVYKNQLDLFYHRYTKEREGIGNAQHFRWMRRVALAYVCKILKGLNTYILTLSALTTLHMRIR